MLLSNIQHVNQQKFLLAQYPISVQQRNVNKTTTPKLISRTGSQKRISPIACTEHHEFRTLSLSLTHSKQVKYLSVNLKSSHMTLRTYSAVLRAVKYELCPQRHERKRRQAKLHSLYCSASEAHTRARLHFRNIILNAGLRSLAESTQLFA